MHTYLSKIHPIVFILLIVGFFFRTYGLEVASLWIDEGYSTNAILAIRTHGYPVLASGGYYTTHLLHSYIAALSSAILGVSEWSLRMPSVIFGTGTILLVYQFAKILFDRHTALFATFLITFATWQIAWSRQIRSYAQMQFFYLLAVYFSFKLCKEFKWSYLLYMTLSAIAAYLSHQLAIVLFPTLIIQILVTYRQPLWQRYLSLNTQMKLFVLFLGLTIITVALYSITRLERIQIAIQQITDIQFDYTQYYTTFFSYEFTIPFLLSIICVIYLFLKRETRYIAYLCIGWYGIPALIISSFVPLLHIRYMFFAFPCMLILSAHILYKTSSIWKKTYLQYIYIGVGILFFFQYLTVIPRTEYQLEFGSPQPDFKSAYSFIKNHKAAYDIIISPYTPLDMWYLGQSDYWIKFSLSGIDSELIRYEGKENEWYTNTPIIHTPEQLIDVTNNNSGYILVDSMFIGKMNTSYINIFNDRFTLVFEKKKDIMNSIWVYYFEPTNEELNDQ
jgi:4-amino-4-deoxy-L-arabinose transferase-like glycosyltransferase